MDEDTKKFIWILELLFFNLVWFTAETSQLSPTDDSSIHLYNLSFYSERSMHLLSYRHPEVAVAVACQTDVLVSRCCQGRP